MILVSWGAWENGVIISCCRIYLNETNLRAGEINTYPVVKAVTAITGRGLIFLGAAHPKSASTKLRIGLRKVTDRGQKARPETAARAWRPRN